MVVAIAGAHGKVALRLIPLLVERGDSVIGLIRNLDHASDVRERGRFAGAVRPRARDGC